MPVPEFQTLAELLRDAYRLPKDLVDGSITATVRKLPTNLRLPRTVDDWLLDDVQQVGDKYLVHLSEAVI